MYYTNPWYLITLMGEPLFWLFFTSASLFFYIFFRKRLPEGKRELAKKVIAISFISVFLTGLIVLSIKIVYPVERPCAACSPGQTEGCNPYCLGDNSFPSGHTSVTFAFFTSLVLVLRKKRYLGFLALPVLVGLSRIFLEVHHPLDVFAGMIIGVTVAIISYEVFKRRYNSFF